MRGRRIGRWGGPAELEDLPEPAPGDGEVLVRVEACGVGLTVLNCMAGDLGDAPEDLPRVPGHELAGTIVETGAGVPRERAGERVVAYFYLFCGWCPACLAGREPLCERLAGFLGVHRDGGYAELATLPERNAIPLPDGIDPVAATTIPDAIATPVHVAERAAIGPGQRVAVIGAGGGVGIHMVQVVRGRGAEVAALDAAPAKLDWLRDELGVPAIESSEFAAASLPWNGGADVVVDLVGSQASASWALGNLAPGGRLVALTTFRDTTFGVSSRALVLGEASILGSRYASRHELIRAARLVGEGRVRPVVGARATIDAVDRIHGALRSGELLGRGALVFGEEESE
jgi:D-arabinose 1-dehydrogenase-like Zn-dependent alcohol dehydrogenase